LERDRDPVLNDQEDHAEARDDRPEHHHGGVADQQAEEHGEQQPAEGKHHADAKQVAQEASPVRALSRGVFAHGVARQPEVADGRDDRDERRNRQEVPGVDHAEMADDDGARGQRGQPAEHVAAKTQHAPADYARAGGGGVEDVHPHVRHRAGQRRVAVGWERRYHSGTGYWTVGVPLPRANGVGWGQGETADSL
jgi:hypothetical protein